MICIKCGVHSGHCPTCEGWCKIETDWVCDVCQDLEEVTDEKAEREDSEV